VVAVGDCARDCGLFAGGHGVAGPVSDVVPVDVQVPGCPRGQASAEGPAV
jgi:Ni,Fe-hydrogenase III small subunit